MDSARAFIGSRIDAPRAMVVVFLRGGADGLTLVPPVGEDSYHRARPGMTVDPADAVRLDDRFGLNSALRELAPWFHEGRLTIVPACGSDDDTRSHFEAQDLMEHAGRLSAGGWLGRHLNGSRGERSGGLSAVSVGTSAPESLRGAPGTMVLQSLDELALPKDRLVLDPLADLYERDPLLATPATDTLAALARIHQLRSQPYSPAHGARYGDDSFSTSLRLIAQLLKARVGTEAVCLDLPGWDSHIMQSTVMESLMRQLATGLAAFAADLGPLLETTSIVVMTEFGRRVHPNSALGTDHGRGGVMLVLGGGTSGGIQGRWPGLDKDQLVEPGDVAVANDYRDVLIPVLTRHAGHAPRPDVFPNHAPTPLSV